MERPVSWQNACETEALDLISGDGCLEPSRVWLNPDDVQQLAAAVRLAGPEADWTSLLEQRITELTGFSYCVAVSSGEAGLAQSLLAAGIRAGDEVIVPSYSPVSVADVVVNLGAVPVLVDIDEATLHLTADTVDDALSDRTAAIIAVHVGGLAVPVSSLAGVADRNGLVLIEDTIGSNAGVLNRERHRRADIVCFRFDSMSDFPLNRGGAICTTDPELAARVRLQRLPAPPLADHSLVVREPGISQLAAAWEFVRLGKVRERWRRRSQIAMTWSAGFGSSNEIQTPAEISGEAHCWDQYMLRLNLQRCSVSRTELVEELQRRGISVGIHYLPIHMHERFQRQFGYGADTFPVSRNEFRRELTLPIHCEMDDAAVDNVWTTLTSILRS